MHDGCVYSRHDRTTFLEVGIECSLQLDKLLTGGLKRPHRHLKTSLGIHFRNEFGNVNGLFVLRSASVIGIQLILL